MNTFEKFKHVVMDPESRGLLRGPEPDEALDKALTFAAESPDNLAAVATVAALMAALNGPAGTSLFIKSVLFLLPIVRAILDEQPAAAAEGKAS